jgi:hypothetical protein
MSQARRLPVMRNPRTRKPRDLSVIYRYATRGAIGASGQRIILETVRTPEMMTTAEAVERFVAALSDPNSPAGVATERSPAQRNRDHDRADRQLQEVGW